MLPRLLAYAIGSLMMLVVGHLSAFGVEGVVKRIDPQQRRLVITAGGQDHTIRVPEGVKVLDSAGKELSEGLRAKDMQEGARVTLNVRRQDGKIVLQSIRLGGSGAPPWKMAPQPAARPDTAGPSVKQDTSQLTPLSDLGQGKYQGFEGGLYPEGKNTRPASHTAAGLKLAEQVQPLDAEGRPSADGKVVLLAIGFSNTVQAFNGFMSVAKEERDLDPRLVLVNKTDPTTKPWFLRPATAGTSASSAAAAAPAGGISAAAPGSDEKTWERLADGSLGQETEFHGVDGVAIPAYIRKPSGPGPFPVVVLAHGGRYGKAPTVGMGRSMQSPVADFIREGWAVYSVDYRPSEKISIELIEFDDTVEAVKTVRKMPFVDPARVGYMGGSHGAQVGSRVVSRVDLSGAILCAPAALDLVEVKRAVVDRQEKLVPILMKLVGDMEQKHGAKAEEIAKDPSKYGYSSALTEAAGVRCPILVINGRNDDNSPVSIIDIYAAKLQAAHKQVETYLPDNGPHGFYWGHPDIPETQEATRRAVAFLQKQFRQKSR